MSGNTLREEVATKLRERILTGAIGRGTRLDLDFLASDFRTSRTPVREALLLLARDGLVEFSPRQSSIVIGFASTDIRDIYVVFGVLLGVAAAAVAQSRGSALLERLEQLALQISEAGDGPGAADAGRADFYGCITSECGSQVLQNQLRQLQGLLLPATFTDVPDLCLSEDEDQWRVVEAIRAADAVAARMVVEGHFAEAGRRICAWMQSGGRLIPLFPSTPSLHHEGPS